MKGNQPKFPTKAELRNAAIRELNGGTSITALSTLFVAWR
jgi:hypothetical protein